MPPASTSSRWRDRVTGHQVEAGPWGELLVAAWLHRIGRCMLTRSGEVGMARPHSRSRMARGEARQHNVKLDERCPKARTLGVFIGLLLEGRDLVSQVLGPSRS